MKLRQQDIIGGIVAAAMGIPIVVWAGNQPTGSTAAVQSAPQVVQTVAVAQPATWDDGETYDFCWKKMRAYFGKQPNYQHTIFPSTKTVILNGDRPTGGFFGIECRDEANGPQVVEIY